MNKLILALEQLQALKESSTFLYIRAAEEEVNYRARILRNRVIMYASRGDGWNGQNPNGEMTIVWRPE